MNSILARSGNLNDFWKSSPVTSVLIILNTIAVLISLVTGGFYGDAFQFGAIYPPFIIELGEWYRLLTGAFLHGSLLHFASNIIIGLFVFSSALERAIGSKKFTFIYFGSLVFSGILIIYLGDYTTASIGASGAIFGVMGSLVYLAIYRRDIMSNQDVKTVGSLVAINLVFTLVYPQISIWGHFGGLAGGFLLSYLVIRRNIFKVIN